jgi:adenosylcobinamide-GDP ribazoletransferase
MVYAVSFFPSAREEGLGYLFKKHCGWRELTIATTTALGCAFFLLGPWGFVVIGGLWLAVAVMAWALTRTLGGLTGDTYGALCEVGEVLTLGMVSLLAKGVLV